MSSAADLLVPKHDGPVAETLRVILHVAGVQAEDAVDDACVFLEQVETAVSGSLVKLKLKGYGEKDISVVVIFF